MNASALLLPVLFLITTIGCGGPLTDASTAEAVRARSQELIAAEVARDIDGTMAFWAENAVLHPSGGPPIQGAAAIRALYEQVLGGDQLKEVAAATTDVKVSSSGELAYEIGTNRAVFSTPEGDVVDIGKYLAVWEHIDGKWLITAISFTSDAPAPVPVAR